MQHELSVHMTMGCLQIPAYDPATGRKARRPQYRYDGIYRVEQAWQKKGCQGHLVCQYFLVRADHEPAAWQSAAGAH